jgi:hypothetical protein
MQSVNIRRGIDAESVHEGLMQPPSDVVYLPDGVAVAVGSGADYSNSIHRRLSSIPFTDPGEGIRFR